MCNTLAIVLDQTTRLSPRGHGGTGPFATASIHHKLILTTQVGFCFPSIPQATRKNSSISSHSISGTSRAAKCPPFSPLPFSISLILLHRLRSPRDRETRPSYRSLRPNWLELPIFPWEIWSNLMVWRHTLDWAVETIVPQRTERVSASD